MLIAGRTMLRQGVNEFIHSGRIGQRIEDRDMSWPFENGHGAPSAGALSPAAVSAATDAAPASDGRVIASAQANILLLIPAELTLLTRHILETAGHLTLAAKDPEKARELLEQKHIDLVLIDLAIAVGHRWVDALFREMVTARWTSKVLLLLRPDCRLPQEVLLLRKRGLMEVLQHPLSPAQLLASVQVLLRRAEIEDSSNITSSDVQIDFRSYRIHRNGRRIDVGPIEFRLLHHLISKSPMVLSRQELIEAAWPRRVHVESRTVDVHIGRLRRELNKSGEPNLIRTVRSIGYSFDSTS